MYKNFEENTSLPKFIQKIDKFIHNVIGAKHVAEMTWKEYAISLLLFNIIGLIFTFLLQISQTYLPLNPHQLPNTSWHSAINTAISFVTNTNWQSYAGEATMSYLTQMLVLTVQNFLSASTGIAVVLVLSRSFSRKNTTKLGNFWLDLSRGIIYILLPLSIILAIILISQGVIQNFSSYQEVTSLEGIKQIIPQGPVASQIAIKQLGTNGGGFFNVNSAHPFENPTPLSNCMQLISILIIPASLVFTFGKIIKSNKQAWTLFSTMLIIRFRFT